MAITDYCHNPFISLVLSLLLLLFLFLFVLLVLLLLRLSLSLLLLLLLPAGSRAAPRPFFGICSFFLLRYFSVWRPFSSGFLNMPYFLLFVLALLLIFACAKILLFSGPKLEFLLFWIACYAGKAVLIAL